MPTFLSDPTLGTYLVLLVVALAAVGLWLRNRDRRTMAFAAVAVALLLALFGIDRAVESPREEAVRKVREMAAAANARNWTAAFTHVSDKFDSYGMSKAKLRAYAEPRATQNSATVHVTDFDREYVEQLPGGRIRVGFVTHLAVPSVDRAPFYVEAEFAPEPDSQYRMVKLDVYNFVTRKQGGVQPLPGQ